MLDKTNLNKFIILFGISIILILFNACRYKFFNPSIMIRTPRNYKFDDFPTQRDSQTVIGINDNISILLLANGGFPLVDLTYGGQSASANSVSVGARQVTFSVEYDGTIKMPVIGRLRVVGMTPRCLEDTLEFLFSKHYRDPYVQVNILNHKVIIFPGQGGSASVLKFQNPNMTLFEAIAAAGGLGGGAKAYRIKLIRGDLKNPKIFLINLATIEGMKDADLILRPNDIIYVEPRERFLEFLGNEIIPWAGLIFTISNFVTTIILIRSFLL